MKTQQSPLDQNGFAALIIGIVLIIILSLITLGFAQLSQHELAQATNRLLSEQAYYAAESGINDAVKAIKADPSLTKPDCPPDPNNQYLNSNIVSSDANSGAAVEWTCLTIDPSPTALKFGNVSTTTPKVFRTWTNAANGISSLTFSWADSNPSQVTGFQNSSGVSNASFPTVAQWKSNVTGNGATGILRIAITPLGSVTRSSLSSNTFTAFLYPANDGTAGHSGSTNYSSDQTATGQIVDGHCNVGSTPLYCSVTIRFGTPIPANQPILFNLRSVYSPTSVQLSAKDGSSNPVDLLGVQTEIDATGKDQNVQKRLQAMLPQTNEYNFPGFTLDSLNGVCKELSVYPNFAQGCGY